MLDYTLERDYRNMDFFQIRAYVLYDELCLI